MIKTKNLKMKRIFALLFGASCTTGIIIDNSSAPVLTPDNLLLAEQNNDFCRRWITQKVCEKKDGEKCHWHKEVKGNKTNHVCYSGII